MSTFTHLERRSYFSRTELLVYLSVLIIGMVLRLYDLGARPLHHDESLHVMYSLYFYDWPDSGYYRYDPMLHGPFLYNFISLVYHTLGVSAAAARAPLAVIGICFVLLPYLFRNYFSSSALIGVTAAVALSPTLTYWSRFLREDYFLVAGVLFAIYGVILAQRRHAPLYIGVGFALQFCSKESTYVHLAVLSGFLVFEHLVDCFFLRERESMLRSLWRYIRTWPWNTLLGLVLFLAIYVYLYTAGLRHLGPEDKGVFEKYFGVLLDAAYRQSIMYWVHQNAIERIKGPFIFHWHVQSWYELPFVIACVYYLYLFFNQTTRQIQAACIALTVLTLAIYFYHLRYPLEGVWLWELLRLKLNADIIGVTIQLGLAPLVTLHHLLRRERALAFWGYLFFAMSFTYCYLGEKVPWLSMYSLICGVIYLALYFDAYFRENPVLNYRAVPWAKIIFGFGCVLLGLALVFAIEEQEFQRSTISTAVFGLLLCVAAVTTHALNLFGTVNIKLLTFVVVALFTLRANVLTNHVYAGRPSEFISQVHTTPEFHDIVLRIRNEIVTRSKGYRARVLALGDPTWPTGAYMIGVPEYKFAASEEEKPQFDYIIDTFDENAAIIPGFKREKITLRGWWLPDYDTMTVKKFLHYSINHHPWSPTGFSYAYLHSRE